MPCRRETSTSSARSLVLACALAATLAPARSTQAEPEVYSWEDESGAVHFSDTAPSDADGPVSVRSVKSLEGFDLRVRPQFAVPASAYVRQVLADRSFARVESQHGGLPFAMDLPADWLELPGPQLTGLAQAVRWAGSLAVARFRRPLSGPHGLPIVLVTVHRGVRPDKRVLSDVSRLAPVFREYWLREVYEPERLDRDEAEGEGVIERSGDVIFDAESETFWSEFEIRASATVRGLFAARFTRKGRITLLAYTYAEQYPSYRPLFQAMLRSIAIPEEDRIFPADAGAARTGRGPPEPPISVARANGAALALVAALAFLMAMLCPPAPVLRALTGGAVLVVASYAAYASAPTPAEQPQAVLAFSVVFYGLVLLAGITRFLVKRPG